MYLFHASMTPPPGGFGIALGKLSFCLLIQGYGIPFCGKLKRKNIQGERARRNQARNHPPPRRIGVYSLKLVLLCANASLVASTFFRRKFFRKISWGWWDVQNQAISAAKGYMYPFAATMTPPGGLGLNIWKLSFCVLMHLCLCQPFLGKKFPKNFSGGGGTSKTSQNVRQRDTCIPLPQQWPPLEDWG